MAKPNMQSVITPPYRPMRIPPHK